jgi:hypothetical protein
MKKKMRNLTIELPNLLVQVRVILSFKERERTVTSAD